MRWIPIAVIALALLATGAAVSETDAAPSEFGLVYFYIDGELVAVTDTDGCVEVAESIDTSKDGYRFLGWTDNIVTKEIVDLHDIRTDRDSGLHAVYEPMPEPDMTWVYIVIGMSVLIAFLVALVYRHL